MNCSITEPSETSEQASSEQANEWAQRSTQAKQAWQDEAVVIFFFFFDIAYSHLIHFERRTIISWCTTRKRQDTMDTRDMIAILFISIGCFLKKVLHKREEKMLEKMKMTQ